MKYSCITALLCLTTNFLFGQNGTQPVSQKHVSGQDTINPQKGNTANQLKKIKARKIKQHSDSVFNQPQVSLRIDSTKQNRYGDLLRDDPLYNKKYPLWVPFVEGSGDNVILNLVDSKISKYPWAMVGPASWKRNIEAGWPWGSGWDWDQTRFGNDFLGHPIYGNFYYNSARSNGYNFWASAPYALIGSYEWKIFGENVTPERNSLIATTIDGILLGEILYRLSSNILDDRTRGRERVFREIAAGLIDPMREFNRLIQGKASRYTNKEVYQKEPLNITVYGGMHKINDHTNAVLSGPITGMLNLQFDYGNPFEDRFRNPFDFFKLRVETDFGSGRKILDNITGYGILWGRNAQYNEAALLEGLFLYYDYFDNNIFELSTIGLGPGIFSKLPLGANSYLYTNAHLAVVPFAGSSAGPISDTAQFRDFNFGYGGEAKFETSLSFGKFGTLGVAYYYFLIRSINSVGEDEVMGSTFGNNSIGVVEPKITLHLYKDMSIGFEYYLYSQIHFDSGSPTYKAYLTEQKIFIQFYFEDPQRRGHYD